MGRAARNVNGIAVLYADKVTGSMKQAMDETDRRRNIQLDYNRVNGITPETIVKPVDMLMVSISEADYAAPTPLRTAEDENIDDPVKLTQRIEELEEEMREAARKFEFERAAELRDRAKALKERQLEIV
jgi:excinuclease ABC subunit B